MEKIAPLGPVYQAGTLSGNPIAVAAGLATLHLIENQTFFERLAVSTTSLVDGLCAAAREAGIPFAGTSVGGMFGIYFADAVPNSYSEVTRCDVQRFGRFFHGMLDAGIYMAPSAFEAGFVSAAHSAADIDATVAAAAAVFGGLK
jgi:glutamate-1-semialdehyde 2,1-aminomutase